ncbi:trypsin Inhibitor like cysteine rich domain protein [Necator americanus]|uniref:Trypsin Inhibitor like cysteine rich domain protein n=1 Tax=Necator americanus TaxID=51031 RepID=W2T018_NECAM|nr:trypsin Inhibitor like cysteine rich domain protein [Necator americanus]ETN74904.1 trypsin Inhibitor like cysteine rich domain protein [Necator americanus]
MAAEIMRRASDVEQPVNLLVATLTLFAPSNALSMFVSVKVASSVMRRTNASQWTIAQKGMAMKLPSRSPVVLLFSASLPPHRIKLCSEMNCPPGTVCELGRVICPFVPPCFTRPTQCGPSATGESSITCANVRCRGGTVCKMVDVVCKKAPCPQRPQCVPDEPFNPCAATTCPVGSECRVKQVQCIRAPCNPIAECYTPPQSGQCGKFETYRSCASHCEPSCTNKSPICILSCAPPKCQCTQGFFRNASGECVTEAECDGNSDTNPYSR